MDYDNLSFKEKLSLFIKEKADSIKSIFTSKDKTDKLKINPIYQATENGALRFDRKHYKNSESERKDNEAYLFFKANPDCFANSGRHTRLDSYSSNNRRQRQRSRDRNRNRT